MTLPRTRFGAQLLAEQAGAVVTEAVGETAPGIHSEAAGCPISRAMPHYIADEGQPTFCAHLQPVTLRQGMQLTIPPGESVFLRGPVTINTGDPESVSMKIREHLSSGMNISSSKISDYNDNLFAEITVKNNNMSDMILTSDVVLAELSISNANDCKAEALIGPCCETPVLVNDHATQCLLDSGSQVTVLSESFFRDTLSASPLQELPEGLSIVGAGGHRVPYIGVVDINVNLPISVTGINHTVKVTAFVCPDTEYSNHVPVIIGTNVFRQYAEQGKRQSGTNFFRNLPLNCMSTFVYSDINNIGDDGKIGCLKAQRKKTVLKSGEVKDVWCYSKIKLPQTRNAILIQEPVSKELPEGVQIFSQKVNTSYHNINCLKITVVNKSAEEVEFKRNQVLADVFLIDKEYDCEKVIQSLSHFVTDAQNAEQKSPSGRVSEEKTVSDIEFKFEEDLPVHWKERWKKGFSAYSDIFIQHKFDIGCTDVLSHDTELEPGPIIRERPRPIPPADFEAARQHIKDLLDAKIISPSTSPYASPIVLVKKKSGALRMCVDYRKINARTIRDSYALPKIEDLFSTLSGAKYFCSVDLSNAYYQVPCTERAKKVSAFTTPFGLFQFERMPMGMTNSACTFQRLMDLVFQDLNLQELIVYLDDILIHGKTLEELEERIYKVFDKLRLYGLKLDPTKCEFGKTKVKHLGYIVSADGISPDPDKVSAIKDWPIPTTVKEVKSFLGFSGFYRRFIPDYASIAKPLNDLTIGYYPRGSKPKKVKSGVATLTLSSKISHKWSEKQQKAFDKLREVLTSNPILGLPDKSKPFELHVDASGTGLGGVLYQDNKVIAYASRGLNRTEANYPAHKREFLALKWAMSDKFKDYLWGSKVTVVTDNNPLCYLLKTMKLDATSHRWLTALSVFDFEIVYKAGRTHTDADELSRLNKEPLEEDEEYLKELEKVEFLREKARKWEGDVVKSVIHSKCMFVEEGVSHVPAILSLHVNPDHISDDVLEPEMRSITRDPPDWRQVQLEDKTLSKIIALLEKGEIISKDNLGNYPEASVYVRERERLILKDGALYRVVKDEVDFEHFCICLPPSKRREAMVGVHNNLFHMGFETALKLARQRFFWPFMSRDLEKKIKNCLWCKEKGARQEKAPMQTIETSFPLELLSIDFLTIESKGKKQNVLVCMDHFTKFSAAFLTKDQKAKTVAKTLWNDFFLVYGFPKKILSDQGRDFESNLIKELCLISGVDKIRTTPYHPAGNPVERWNRTLIGMLRGQEKKEDFDWRKCLKECVHAYNCLIHSSTGASPYYLFFGRQPRLPVDILFGLDRQTKVSTRQYIKSLKSNLSAAYAAAKETMKSAAKKNSKRYNLHANAHELQAGDHVLVRKVGNKGKIENRWESDVYVVKDKKYDSPVYSVHPEDDPSKLRTLHRNLLLPIDAVLEMNDNAQDTPIVSHPANSPSVAKKAVRFNVETEEDEPMDNPTFTVRLNPSSDLNQVADAAEVSNVERDIVVIEDNDTSEIVVESGESEESDESESESESEDEEVSDNQNTISNNSDHDENNIVEPVDDILVDPGGDVSAELSEQNESVEGENEENEDDDESVEESEIFQAAPSPPLAVRRTRREIKEPDRLINSMSITNRIRSGLGGLQSTFRRKWPFRK